MRPIVFPYTPYRGHPAPIIPVEIHGKQGWTTIWAYVDSGASTSILRPREAAVLGLRLEAGQLTYVEITAPIGFSPKLGVGFNLLGRQDIFTHFDITFSDATRTVTFRPRVR